MILINTKTNESYQNCSSVFISNKIGIDARTIGRWKKDGRIVEKFNQWIVYFYPEIIKQKKGFALTK